RRGGAAGCGGAQALGGVRCGSGPDVGGVLPAQVSVGAPAKAGGASVQVGSTLRRTDKQQDTGLLLAMVGTVTVNRETAEAVSSDTNPGGAVQKPRAIEATQPPTNIALPHEGLTYRFPFDTEKKTYP